MKTSNTLFSLVLVSISFFVTSCSAPEPNEPLAPAKDRFLNNQIILEANNLDLIVDVPLTLTTTCIPLFSGVGYINIQGGGAMEGSWFTVLQPIQDTLRRTSEKDKYFGQEFEFFAGDTFSVEWIICLQSNVPYTFSAIGNLTQPIVEDSTELYNYDLEYIYRYNLQDDVPLAISSTISIE